MDSNKGYYSIVEVLPDRSRQESVNAGIARIAGDPVPAGASVAPDANRGFIQSKVGTSSRCNNRRIESGNRARENSVKEKAAIPYRGLG